MLTLSISDLIVNSINEYESILESMADPVNTHDILESINKNKQILINSRVAAKLGVKSGTYMLNNEGASRVSITPIELSENTLKHKTLKLESLKAIWKDVIVESEKDDDDNVDSFDDEDQQANFTSRFDVGNIDRNAILQAMKDQNISVTDLADKVGVDKSTISRYLRKPDAHGQGDPGGRDPSIQNAAKLANYLRTNIQSLFPDLFKVGRKQKKRKANRGSGVTSVTKNIKGASS